MQASVTVSDVFDMEFASLRNSVCWRSPPDWIGRFKETSRVKERYQQYGG